MLSEQFYIKKVLFTVLAIWFLFSCDNSKNSKNQIPSHGDSSNHATVDSSLSKNDSIFNRVELLTSLMSNKIRLDSLLDKITHQEKVKVITELNSVWDDTGKVYRYFDSNYSFKLKIFGFGSNEYKLNSILYDGKDEISFGDYKISCFDTTNYSCLTYGYNDNNSLEHPKIIEVCGKKYLYSDISFNCNGKGCGCVLTLIYDLITKKPVFIENYRIPYKGFFISDFNNDNNPDLLIIQKSSDDNMKGFNITDFEFNLYAYTYAGGKFIPTVYGQYLKPASFKLYGIGEWGEYTYLTYSIIENNWFRQ
jgi:hypothetical protein